MSFHSTLFLCLLFAAGLGTGSSTPEVDVIFKFVITVYKDGTYKKFDEGRPKVPAMVNATNGVQSKDVVIRQDTGVNARLYVPKDYQTKGKLPVVVYIHGGGFCTGNAADIDINEFVTTIVDKANVVAVSVNFRMPPEHKLPVAYDDTWTALKWLADHAVGKGTEQCLQDHVDFSRVFIAGDSSGANIAHNLAMRFGKEELPGIELAGMILLSPYFVPKVPTPSMMSTDEDMRNNMTKIWPFVCPTTSGLDDPRVDPMMDPKLPSIGCKKVLINVAGLDPLLDAGKAYADALQKRARKVVEIFESPGKMHDHQLRKMDAEVMDRVTSFVNN